LISESLDGLSVAATLQNAGRFVSDGFACTAVDPGAVNVPAETVWASEIVVFGNERAVRLSHVAAFTDVATSVIPANRTANLMIFTFMLSSRRDVLTGVARDSAGIWSQLQARNTTLSAAAVAVPSPVKSGAGRPDLA